MGARLWYRSCPAVSLRAAASERQQKMGKWVVAGARRVVIGGMAVPEGPKDAEKRR